MVHLPQIKGLGPSSTSQRFATSGLHEGAAYLEHPILGRRLEECTVIVNDLARFVEDVFGYGDDATGYNEILQLEEKIALSSPGLPAS